MRRILLLAVVGVLVIGVSFSASAAEKVQKVTVTLTDFAFTPKAITLTAGTEAQITIVNKGKVEHEFMVYPVPTKAVDDWDEYVIPSTYFQKMGEVEVVFSKQGAVAGSSIFEVELDAGRSATLVFTPNRKGTFELGCHAEGHYEAGMKGTFVVK